MLPPWREMTPVSSWSTPGSSATRTENASSGCPASANIPGLPTHRSYRRRPLGETVTPAADSASRRRPRRRRGVVSGGGDGGPAWGPRRPGLCLHLARRRTAPRPLGRAAASPAPGLREQPASLALVSRVLPPTGALGSGGVSGRGNRPCLAGRYLAAAAAPGS